MNTLQTSRCRDCDRECVRSIGYCVHCIPPDPTCEHVWSDWTTDGDIEIYRGRARMFWSRGCELCGEIVHTVKRAGHSPASESTRALEASWLATP